MIACLDLICTEFRPSTRLYIVCCKVFFLLPTFLFSSSFSLPSERVDTLIIKSTSSRHAHSASRNYSRRVNVHGFVWISKYMRICNTKPFVSWTEKLLYIIRSFFLQAFPRVESFEFLNYVVAGNNSKQTAREIRV